LNKNIEILFEDESIVAVHKSAGILSIPDRFNPTLPNLLHLLQRIHNEIIPVHRLDKYTSGVNIFAKTADAHKILSSQFESGSIGKFYYAIVDRVPDPTEGEINVAIGESQSKRGKMVVLKKGKACLTRYRVIESYRNFSWLEVQLFTGRTHQIRVHLQYIGHPLVVDSLYGKRESFSISEIKTSGFKSGNDQTVSPLLERQPLHAHAIEFENPITGLRMRIEAPLPKDMKACITQLRKWSPENKRVF
jgi:23S rRNA pseudouridine1911/1915/1917 synthase